MVLVRQKDGENLKAHCRVSPLALVSGINLSMKVIMQQIPENTKWKNTVTVWAMSSFGNMKDVTYVKGTIARGYSKN